MQMTSTKPYMVKAIYEWIIDNNFTPYIMVDCNYPGVQVPWSYVNQGKILLNVSVSACHDLHFGIDHIMFNARFSGKVEHIVLSPLAILSIYAKENGHGMEFAVDYSQVERTYSVNDAGKKSTKPFLTLVRSKDK